MNVVVASPDLNVGMADQVEQERDVGLHAADAELAQRAIRALHRFLERAAPGRDLDQQRVEVRRDDRAAEAVAAVEPDGEAAGRAIGRDPAVVGDEMSSGSSVVMRHCIAKPRRSILSCGGMFDRRLVQRVALRDQDLAAHEVDAGDDLGHGVLDLDARVHLDEEELAAIDVEQELDGAGVAIADRRHSVAAASQMRCRSSCGRLMLGAISTTFWWRRWTEQSRSQRCTRLPCASPRICTSMCLARAMYRSRKTSGRPNAAPASRCASSSLASSSSALVHDAHPAAAAAEARLDHQRDSRSRAASAATSAGSVSACSVPGTVGTPADCASRLAAVLSPNASSCSGVGPDERDAGVLARARERRVLRQEAVARMNRVDALRLGDRDDRLDVEIRAHRLAALRRADEERLVGLEAVQREAVFVAVDRDGPQPEFGGGPEAADGDFRAVGDEQFPHSGDGNECPRDLRPRQE